MVRQGVRLYALLYPNEPTEWRYFSTAIRGERRWGFDGVFYHLVGDPLGLPLCVES